MVDTTYITFGVYILVMAAIGIYFAKKAANSLEDYLLGGRNMGSYVTAFSAQASDMSGWLLMGLPGTVFLFGLGESWIAIGLLIGTFLNWLLVAGRLRIFTEDTRALTLASFLSHRFKDPSKIIRLSSAALTLGFFTVYAASGLAGAGRLFEELFGIEFKVAVISGSAVMIFYTLLGGFLAVCWTDLIQGILMFVALTVLPLVIYSSLPPDAIVNACANKNISLNFFPESESFWLGIVVIFSAASWGLGYFGQPHILSRFMSIRSIKLLPKTITVAMIWVVISLIFAVFIGVIGIALYPNEQLPGYIVSPPHNEKIFIYMIGQFCAPAFSGVLFAAILAAIMSTIDSQLLASSSTLIEDIYQFLFRKNIKSQEQMWVSRLAVLAIAVLATFLALDPEQTVFGLVKFAWGGLGAVFGPAVLAALYWRRSSYIGIISGMIMGTVVLLGYYALGYGAVLYEIVPGFAANCIGILLFSWWFPPHDKVTDLFDSMVQRFRSELQKSKEDTP